MRAIMPEEAGIPKQSFLLISMKSQIETWWKHGNSREWTRSSRLLKRKARLESLNVLLCSTNDVETRKLSIGLVHHAGWDPDLTFFSEPLKGEFDAPQSHDPSFRWLADVYLWPGSIAAWNGASWLAINVKVLPPSKQLERPSFSVSSVNSRPIWAV